ncbi:MAG TPA: type III-A CRISPR-associated protein Csm2 [bacterium]|nr:type III-A CRISPR-associated protein Csm2 [bacterium]HOL35106.1 type III-A CRISPR-associated protein Csm2 [bacterium]HPP08367.1 type III-A CRISPR-associated protein Csm2 [bacterium]
MNNVDKNKIMEIINNGNVTIMNEYAENLAKQYAPQEDREKKFKLTASQIRNILDDVQRMDKKAVGVRKHELLRPKLAYIAGRSDKNNYAIRELKEILDIAIRSIGDDYKKFENFRNFLEAIVGYHKFYSQVRE